MFTLSYFEMRRGLTQPRSSCFSRTLFLYPPSLLLARVTPVCASGKQLWADHRIKQVWPGGMTLLWSQGPREKGDRSGEALWLQGLQGAEQVNLISWKVNNYLKPNSCLHSLREHRDIFNFPPAVYKLFVVDTNTTSLTIPLFFLW